MTNLSRPICGHCGKAYGRRRTRMVTVSNGGTVELKEGELFVRSQQVGKQDFVDIWDGTWWGGYRPFCTLRCALDYARRAYAAAQALRPKANQSMRELGNASG